MHKDGLSDSCEICLRLFIRLGFFELLCERKEAPLQMHTNHCPFLNCDSSLTSLQKHSLLTLTRMKTINPNSPRANALHSTYNTQPLHPPLIQTHESLVLPVRWLLPHRLLVLLGKGRSLVRNVEPEFPGQKIGTIIYRSSRSLDPTLQGAKAVVNVLLVPSVVQVVRVKQRTQRTSPIHEVPTRHAASRNPRFHTVVKSEAQTPGIALNPLLHAN